MPRSFRSLCTMSVTALAAFTAGLTVPRHDREPGVAHRNPASLQPGEVRTAVAVASVGHGTEETQASLLPRATRVWREALALPEGAWRELEVLRAWKVMAADDPALAWSASFALTDGAALRATLTADAAALKQWLSGTPDEHRPAATLEAAAMLTVRAPAEGLEFLRSLPESSLRSDAQALVAAHWAESDPAAAAEWCRTHDENALAGVLSKWSENDPMAASEWLAAQPAGAARESGVLCLIEPLMSADPASAWVWAQSLTDGDTRRAMMQRTAAAWRDSTAAELPPEVESAAAEWTAALARGN